jgi:hypothetical protein
MAAVGTPLENAQAESFMRTLKCEEVYLNDYTRIVPRTPRRASPASRRTAG